MGYIHCCAGLRKSRSFVLIPAEGFVACELDYISACPICGNRVIQVTRIDVNNSISMFRVKNMKAKKLWEKLKSMVLYEKNIYPNIPSGRGTFYLNYNEYGIKKRCYSNLSNLKLGLP